MQLKLKKRTTFYHIMFENAHRMKKIEI